VKCIVLFVTGKGLKLVVDDGSYHCLIWQSRSLESKPLIVMILPICFIFVVEVRVSWFPYVVQFVDQCNFFVVICVAFYLFSAQNVYFFHFCKKKIVNSSFSHFVFFVDHALLIL